MVQMIIERALYFVSCIGKEKSESFENYFKCTAMLRIYVLFCGIS